MVQQHNDNTEGFIMHATKFTLILLLAIALFSGIPAVNADGDYHQLIVHKYACEHSTQLTAENEIDQQTGAHTVPETCSPQENVAFGYYYQEEQTSSGPYSQGNFTQLQPTDQNGKIEIAQLAPGRYELQELNNQNEPVADQDVLYLGCTGDTGQKTDNNEYTFVNDGETAHCVVYNTQEPLVCEHYPEERGHESINSNGYELDVNYASTEQDVSIALEIDPSLSKKKFDEWLILAIDKDQDGQADFRLAWTSEKGRFAPNEWGSYQTRDGNSWNDWVVRPHDISFDYNDNPYNYFNWTIPTEYFNSCGHFSFALYGEGRQDEFFFPQELDQDQTKEVDPDTSSTDYYPVPQEDKIHEPLTCEQAIEQGEVTSTWNPNTGEATVHNNANVAYNFTYASYEKNDLNVSIPKNQTLFDNQTVEILPGDSFEFNISVPQDCAYQIDLVCGQVIENLDLETYGDRKLRYAHPTDQKGACVDEPQEPINFCEQGVMHLDTSSDESVLSKVNTTSSETTELVRYDERLRSSVALDSNGVLYSLKRDGGNTGDLVILEDDGSITSIGDTGIRNNAVALEFAPNGKLYAANQPRDEIFEINKSTGQTTLIRTFDADIDGGDIVFNEYSELFYVQKTGNVYNIDLNTQNYSLVGTLPAGFITSAAYTDGVFYAMDESSNELYNFTLDPFTYELIGDEGEFGFGDATVCPVEPQERPVCEEFEEASGTIQTSSQGHDIEITYDSTRDGVDVAVEFSPELSDKKNEEWLTLAIDSDNDGVADFQLGWTAQEGYFAPGEWGSYREVVNGTWSEWVKRPNNISFEYNNDPYDYFNWSIPGEFFDTCGPFRFAVNGFTGFDEFVFPDEVSPENTSSEFYYVVPPGSNDPEPTPGSIEICKAVVHENGTYADDWSALESANFSMPVTIDGENFTWSTNTDAHTSIIGANGVTVRGVCEVVESVEHVGEDPVLIEYGPEVIQSSANYSAARYNEHFSSYVDTSYLYGESTKSDGEMYLTQTHPDKKLLLINTLLENATIPDDGGEGNESDGNSTDGGPTDGNQTDGNQTDGNQTNGNETNGGGIDIEINATVTSLSGSSGGGGSDGGLNSWLNRFEQEEEPEPEPESTGDSGSSPGVTVEQPDEESDDSSPAVSQEESENQTGNLLTGAVVGGGAGGWIWALLVALLVGAGAFYASRN